VSWHISASGLTGGADAGLDVVVCRWGLHYAGLRRVVGRNAAFASLLACSDEGPRRGVGSPSAAYGGCHLHLTR
jgi:hypothetical protein